MKKAILLLYLFLLCCQKNKDNKLVISAETDGGIMEMYTVINGDGKFADFVTKYSDTIMNPKGKYKFVAKDKNKWQTPTIKCRMEYNGKTVAERTVSGPGCECELTWKR